jgi:mxaJ protein
MCSSSLRVAAVILGCSVMLAASTPFTVCADPQNAPFSSRENVGFENQIAKVIAAQLDQPLRIHWARMGRGFVREVLNKGACDAIIAAPVGMRGLLVTKPYYRSTYVFVTRRDEQPIRSFEDPRLLKMKIGVQVLDDDYAPPARALARRGLTKNIVGFEMDSNAGQIIAAVAEKKIDTAVVWGPLAGYYARRYERALRLSPVSPQLDPPSLPFTFEIGVGVRKSEPELYERMQQAVHRAQPEITQILKKNGVPLLPLDAVPNKGGQ